MNDDRRELGAFLRTRRARVSPAELGLPSGGRRRTPGLRREEVAQLAGVGVTWYTWLEQGRDIHPSASVLSAVAGVLGLTVDERAYLFDLAGVPRPVTDTARPAVDDAVLDLLARLGEVPAYVQNASYDLLAYNDAFRFLVTDLDELPVEERNTMWLAFTDAAWRAGMPDWESVTGRMVAHIRTQTAPGADRAKVTRLVTALGERSARFRELWERHDVAAPRSSVKVYDSPRWGRLSFTVVTTWLQPGQGERLLVHLPADAGTARALERAESSRSAAGVSGGSAAPAAGGR